MAKGQSMILIRVKTEHAFGVTHCFSELRVRFALVSYELSDWWRTVL